eukprot:GFYU01006291.1.p1 GENE.GFYU01006291.1~~GFYU01006291.1.p1  ORF type:complete len:670 (-),score=228.27 GFYU01006291.1:99-1847(-)
MYDEALEVMKDHTVSMTNRAMVYIKLQRYEDAIKDCELAIHLEDKCFKGYVRRATAYQRLGQFVEALEDVEVALKLEPHNKELQRMKKSIVDEKEAAAKEELLKAEAEKEKAKSKYKGKTDVQIIEDVLDALDVATTTYEDAKPLIAQLVPTLSKEENRVVFRSGDGVIKLIHYCPAALDQHDCEPFVVLAEASQTTRVGKLVAVDAIVRKAVQYVVSSYTSTGEDDESAKGSAKVINSILQLISTLSGDLDSLVELEAHNVLEVVPSVVRHGTMTQKAFTLQVVQNCAKDTRFRRQFRDALKNGTQALLISLLVDSNMSSESMEILSGTILQMSGDTALRTFLLKDDHVLQTVHQVLDDDRYKVSTTMPAKEVSRRVVVGNLLGVVMTIAIEKTSHTKIEKVGLLASTMAYVNDVVPVAARAIGALGRLPFPEVIVHLRKDDSLKKLSELVTVDDQLLVESAVKCIARALGGCEASVISAFVAADGIPNLAEHIKNTGSPDTLAGNVALALSSCASTDEGLAALKNCQVIAALVNLMHKRDNDGVKKNAAIALARMAKDGEVVDKIRELHGFEIMYRYVKP